MQAHLLATAPLVRVDQAQPHSFSHVSVKAVMGVFATLLGGDTGLSRKLVPHGNPPVVDRPWGDVLWILVGHSGSPVHTT